MSALPLHDFHCARGAVFTTLNSAEAVARYGDAAHEYRALTESAGLLDLSFRSRLCILGNDREKFLHGQVTNDVLRLKPGQGCYAALVNAKGRIQSDLFVYKLRDEILLDFEPGLGRAVAERLERYVIADDVQIVDVAPHYGLLSLQGPRSEEWLRLAGFTQVPAASLEWTARTEAEGELYCMNNPRLGSAGFDLFVPAPALERWAQALSAAAPSVQARWCGLEAFETVRIENAIPRFGADMTESNLAPEAEIQERAISYSKGCYIGQEVIARIRTYGQVSKALRLLDLGSAPLPASGTKLLHDGREVGYLTSSTLSPRYSRVVALGYVRKEVNAPGGTLQLPDGTPARIIGVPGKSTIANQ